MHSNAPRETQAGDGGGGGEGVKINLIVSFPNRYDPAASLLQSVVTTFSWNLLFLPTRILNKHYSAQIARPSLEIVQV